MTVARGVPRRAAGTCGGVLAELPTRVEREPVVGQGEGGDETTAIDAAAEPPSYTGSSDSTRTSRSSRRSSASACSAAAGRGVSSCDPIDGSLNAKRGIPFYSLSLAVADGATMGDVVFGYVYDFGTGEEWTAERGRGASLNGALLGGVKPKDEIEMLSFEGTTTAEVAEQGGRDGRHRPPPPHHGLARALALPPSRRPR